MAVGPATSDVLVAQEDAGEPVGGADGLVERDSRGRGLRKPVCQVAVDEGQGKQGQA